MFKLKFKQGLTACLALLILSCNNNKPKKVTLQEVKLEDITQEESKSEPPPPPPPKAEIAPVNLDNCFSNEGLKYATTIKLGFNDAQVVGYIESAEIGSDKKTSAFFQGTKNGNELKVEFNPKNSAPVIGDASEWTNKAWMIKKVGGKEMLQIVFKAKNYDTNKWEETIYEFEKTDCKK